MPCGVILTTGVQMFDLVQDGVIRLFGVVLDDGYAGDGEARAFCPSMVAAALAQFSGDVTVLVNSPGGHPSSGEAIRDMLSRHSGNVTVRVTGDAASAASLMIMGANRIEMTRGSTIMIHDPSVVTIGDAADHRRSLDRLNVLATVYANVYAQRSGLPIEDIRAMMAAETWFGPEDAILNGFADAVVDVDGVAPGSMSVDRQIEAAQGRYAEMRARFGFTGASTDDASSAQAGGLSFEGRADGASQTAGVSGATMAATVKEGGNMPEQENAAAQGGETVVATTTQTGGDAAASMAVNVDDIRAQERDRIAGINRLAAPHMASLPSGLVDGMIAEGVSMDAASRRILDALANQSAGDISMRDRPGNRVSVGREDRETRIEGLTMALTARLGGDVEVDDRARPFMDYSITAMAAVAMGGDAPRDGLGYARREDVLMSAMHTGSDFSNILSTSVNRIIEQQYDLIERTFAEVSREITFNDFRAHDVVRPDEFPGLDKVNESGEIKFGKLGDSGETVALGAFATGIRISRQALVNDDLGAIQDVLDSAAAIVPEFEETVFWNMVLANGKLGDGKAMFHADHGNLAGAGTALTVAAVSAGRQALRTMKAADGKRTIAMNAPSILLVGPALETEAEKFLNTSVVPDGDDKANPFKGKLRPIVTETIADNSWYLLVDPAKRSCNFRHGYLRDRAAPRVRVSEPFGTQGMAMTLEHDFGVGGVNHRGGYKNPGV